VQASNGFNFMRQRRNIFIGLLLCALALSGWGSVLAAALCPHGMKASVPISTPTGTGEHATCHAESNKAAAHHSAPQHEAIAGMATEAAPQTKEASRTLETPSQSCWHCISHSNLPAAPVSPRESQSNTRETNQTAAEDKVTFAPPVVRFVPAVLPVQGSPPGQLVAKYLLLNTFII
jgi:hypothetical protein